MPIEYKQPIASEYDSPVEYATALLDSVAEYRKACFRAIDRSAIRGAKTTHYEAHKPSQSATRYNTIHDFLSDRPMLLKRYKEIGPMALLELD